MGIRVQVAVALVHRAELLVLDELISGLDPLACDELLDKPSEFMTDERHSVLFSAYITADLDRVTDLVITLDMGGVVTAGARGDLLGTWVMARGGTADFTDELRTRIRGPRRHSAGWKGLTAAADLRLCDTSIMMDTPSVEDLLVHLTEERKDA